MENQIFNGVKKQIIIAILIFLAIIVIGMGVYYFNNKKPSTGLDNNNIVNQEKQIKPPVKKLSCEDIKDAKQKETCQAGVIKLLNSDNSSVCDSLISEADKNSCRNSYIIKEAAQSGDLNKCKQITDKALSANCLAQASFSLAIQKKDKKYCENIINQTDKENCFKVLADMGVK